ncbi:MAG: DUF1614 domain-containing protein [Methylovirgula sp.]|jgi:uncharacterized membrane protein
MEHLDRLQYLPLTMPFFAGLVIVFLGVVALIEIGILRYAFMTIGIGPRPAMILLLATLIGSYINIPVAELPARKVVADQIVDYFGMRYAIPTVVEWPGTIVAINVGGALIPFLLSLYLLSWNHIWGRGLIAIACVAVVCHLLAYPVHGVGIAEPIFVPPFATAIIAVVISRDYAAPLAYVGGSMGTMIGADLLNLDKVQGLGAPVASIGGAGTFDDIFLTGIIAVLLAGITQPRFKPGPAQ